MKGIKTNHLILAAILLLSLSTALTAICQTAIPKPFQSVSANQDQSLKPIERELIKEVNLFRSNPAAYAQRYIAPLRTYYQGKILYLPGETPIQTHEGVKALEECVRILQKEKPRKQLNHSLTLSKAARLLQSDQENTGTTGHTDSNGAGMRKRIEQVGQWKGYIAENIAYGYSTARQFVVFLLIDDGVKNRGHRNNLLLNNVNYIGVAHGKHPIYGSMCVVDFASEIAPYKNRNINHEK